MKIYQVRALPFSGSNYKEVYKKASLFYGIIRKKTKRRAYVRSAYWGKEKIFLPLFWSHLHEKLNFRDKTRRVKYFACAIELLEQSTIPPESKDAEYGKAYILHRFGGKTKTGQHFFVQVKEEKRSGEKWLVSVFPVD